MSLDLPPDQREIFAALHQVWDVLRTRRWERLRTLLAPDFVCVGAGLTERLGREAFLAHVASVQWEDIEEWELHSPVVQRGPVMSVIYAQFRCMRRRGEQRHEERGHTVDVFRREGDRWLWAGNVTELHPAACAPQ